MHPSTELQKSQILYSLFFLQCRTRCRHLRCIENEILMVMRSSRKSARDVYLYDSIGADKEGNEINLMDIIEYEDEDIAERLTREGHLSQLAGFLESALTPREQEIIQMRYGLYGGKEKTQREIAQMFHISRSYVYKIAYYK